MTGPAVDPRERADQPDGPGGAARPDPGNREPDLRYQEIEEDLRATVRALLAGRNPATEPPEPFDRVLWRRLAGEIGCAGLAVPEALGGAGASWREVAVVLEELGRAVAPVPYLGSAVATAALLACPTPPAATLAAQAAGELVIALAVPFATAPGPGQSTVDSAGGRLTGAVPLVADAIGADLLLVPAAGGLFAVDPAAARRTPVVSLDQTRPLCQVELDRVPGQPLCDPDQLPAVLTAALTAGAVLLASEQLGVAGWCLDSTVAYLRERVQFARPVGSFQAVKHRLADVWVALTGARAAARYAADTLATGGADLPVAAALAQASCGPTAVYAAEECVQLHGGIGFTWEHPAHRYLKRAKSAALAFGTADRHRATLATLVDLPPPT